MASMRPVEPRDGEAIARLCALSDFPRRSPEGWRWALFDLPGQGDVPAGYVWETEGGVAAFMGSQRRRFHRGDETFYSLVGHTLVSGPGGRGGGMRMVRHAISTPGIDAYYTLNNNALSAPLYKRLGFTAWLGAPGRTRVDWPVRPFQAAAGVALNKASGNRRLYRYLTARERFAGKAIGIAAPQADSVRRLDPFDSGDAAVIDRFHDDLRGSGTVVSDRRASIYAHMLSDPDGADHLALWGLFSGDVLAATLMLSKAKHNAFEPATLEVLDIAFHPDSDREGGFRTLISAARRAARASGCARLRLMLWGGVETGWLKGTGPRLVREAGHDSTHFIFPGGSAMQGWQPSPFDGDQYFAFRRAPRGNGSGG